MYSAIAHRNMPIIAVFSLLFAPLAAMLAFHLITDFPSPISGFDAAMNKNASVTSMFATVCVIICIAMLGICAYCVLNIWKKRDRPYLTMAITILFAFLIVMEIGIVISGYSHERQLLIFESVCFFVAGLIVMVPIASLVYFGMTLFLFVGTFTAGGFLTPEFMLDIVYVTFINVVVSWVIYSLFARSVARERAVADQSRRDELTGAKNRHYLRDDFESYVDKDVFVLLCDIDDFKQYNDSYSHDVGDALLRQFYFALREAYGDECCYRYGGDEFFVVTHEFGVEDFLNKAEKVRAQLKQTTVDEQSLPISFSGGYVHGTPKTQGEFRNYMHQADENLLEAKRRGKNQLVG